MLEWHFIISLPFTFTGKFGLVCNFPYASRIVCETNDYEHFQSGVKGPDPESAGGIKGEAGAPVRQKTNKQTNKTTTN